MRSYIVTVLELKNFLNGLPDDMLVVTDYSIDSGMHAARKLLVNLTKCPDNGRMAQYRFSRNGQVADTQALLMY